MSTLTPITTAKASVGWWSPNMASHTSATPPNATTGLAGDQPGALPILSSDPSRSDLPTDENNDPVPLLYLNNGTTTGDTGDVMVAAPDGSGGVDIAVAGDTSASITLGVDGTGLL